MLSIEALKQDREVLSRQLAAIDNALKTLSENSEPHPQRSSVLRQRRSWTQAQRDRMAAKQRKVWKERRAKERGQQ